MVAPPDRVHGVAVNYCVPMRDGSLRHVTPDDAELVRAVLCERMTHGPEGDQGAALRMIRHMDDAMAVELHFGDLCTMPNAQPGWVSDR